MKTAIALVLQLCLVASMCHALRADNWPQFRGPKGTGVAKSGGGLPHEWSTEKNVAWTRSLYDALQPHASGAFLLNFLDQEDDAVIRASFGSNYDRLAALKRKYDPENFFRQNQNIRPAP